MSNKDKIALGVREIDQVLEQYRHGSRCTSEVSTLTGLSVKKVSAYSRELIVRGELRRAGHFPRPGGIRGRRQVKYEPV